MVENLKTGVAGTGRGRYSSVEGGQEYHGFDDDEGTSALYSEAGNDDFFHEFGQDTSKSAATSSNQSVTPSGAKTQTIKKKEEEWDDNEWKDF